jgi:hypothetical protein
MTEMKEFRWFWAWDDEKEETWLRDMAQKGWHFKSASIPGNYIFEQGEARDDVYRLDHFTGNGDKAAYLQLFIDSGWEYMGEMNSWQYFRKTAQNGEAPEIFSDNESKAKKYQKILLVMVVFSMPFGNLIRILNQDSSHFFEGLTFFMFLVFMFYVYAIVMLLRRILALKKKL